MTALDYLKALAVLVVVCLVMGCASTTEPKPAAKQCVVSITIDLQHPQTSPDTLVLICPWQR